MTFMRKCHLLLIILSSAGFAATSRGEPGTPNPCSGLGHEVATVESTTPPSAPLSWARSELPLARRMCHERFPVRTDVPPELNIDGPVRSGVQIRELQILQRLADESGLSIGIIGSRQQGWARWSNGRIGPWSGKPTSDLDMVALTPESFMTLLDVIPPERVRELRAEGLQLDHSVVGIMDRGEVLGWDGFVVHPRR